MLKSSTKNLEYVLLICDGVTPQLSNTLQKYMWRQICSVICQNEAGVAATSSKCKTAAQSFKLDWITLFD